MDAVPHQGVSLRGGSVARHLSALFRKRMVWSGHDPQGLKAIPKQHRELSLAACLLLPFAPHRFHKTHRRVGSGRGARG